MKLKTFTKRLLILTLLITGAGQAFGTALNGTYTIDPAGAATTTNFKTFASAITYMTSSSARADGGPVNASPFGVSGPVVFQVAAGTYTVTAAIVVPAITGSSVVNTVTFDGGAGNAATRIITGSLSSQAVVRMNLCNYVRFQNLTINNTYSGACSGIAIVGNTSTNIGLGCAIKRCIVNLSNNVSGSTGYAINMTGTTSGHSASTQMRSDSLVIDSNVTTGGTYGIALYGSGSTTYNKGIKIRGNTINTCYNYGISVNSVYNGTELSYNTINMSTLYTSTGSYGIYFYQCQNASGNISHQLIGNRIMNGVGYGMYIYTGTSSATYPTKIYNNIVGSGSRVIGMYLYSTGTSASTVNHYQVYHNTIVMDVPSASQAFYYRNGTTTTATGSAQIRNNIFAVTTLQGTVYPAQFYTNATNTQANHNVYYNAANATLLVRSTGTIYNASNYKTSTAGGDSSFNAMPSFVSTANPHLTDGCNSFKGRDLTASVPLDYDRETRAVPPQVGADEVIALTNDVRIDQIITPVAPITLGTQDITVRVRNLSSAAVTYFDIGYTLNGGTPVTQSWSGSLNPCDTVSVTFTGGNQVTLGGSNALKVFTYNPNFSADLNPANDTITSTLVTPMAGNYTINGTAGATNFATFAAAFASLAQAGVSAPVTFTVSPGTYSGVLTLPSNIPGASASAPVVFDGVSTSNRTITASASASAVVNMNLASYVTFRNFTITNTSSGTGVGVAIIGNASSNRGSGCAVKNCVINLVNASSTSYGINVTSSANGYGLTAAGAEGVEIDSNTVNGAMYAIAVTGASNAAFNSNLKIRRNTTNNTLAYGVYVNTVYNAVDILNNNFNLLNTTSYTQYGIRFINCQNPATSASHNISGNRIPYASYMGMDIEGCASSVTYPTRITNNLVSNCTYYAIYMYNSSGTNYWEFYHNSVRVSHMDANYGLYFYNASGGGQFKNNIFVVDALAGGMYPAYFASNPSGNSVNYNIYYNSANANLLYRSGDRTASNYLNSSAGGDSSFNFNPYVSGTDMHIASNCVRGLDLTASVPLDIEGDTRIVPPSIGADEFVATSTDVSVDAIMQPVFPVSAGTQDLVVKVHNNGSTAISTFNLSYSINSGTPVTYAWSGTLNPCDTTSVTFTGSQQVTIGAGVNLLKVYSSSPNSSTDTYLLNDTINASIGPPLAGIYTIGATASDFTSFNAALTAMLARGVGGNVTFDVRTGTYNENLVMIPVPGITGNTVEFRSMAGVADSVVLTGQTTGYTLMLVNSENVVFRNITINAPQAGASGVNLAGSATNDTLYGCRILVPNNNYTSYGLMVSNTVLSGVTLRKNVFSGAYYNIEWVANSTYPSTGCVIDSNIFTGGYYSTIYNFQYNDSIIVRGNTFNVCSGGYDYNEHYWYYNNGMDLNGNTFTLPSAAQMYWDMEMNPGTSNIRTKIRNNKMTCADNTAYYSLYWYYENDFLDFYNNSMFLGQGELYFGYDMNTCRFYNNTLNSASSGATLNYDNSGNSGVVFKNNVFSNTGGGVGLYFNASTPSPSQETFDNNLYYSSGSYLIYDYNTSIATLPSWRSAYSSYDRNSVSYMPGFTSETNLTPNLADSAVWALNGRGAHYGDSSDINGASRPGSVVTGAPDIGAYEITPTSVPPRATATPTAPAAGTTQLFLFAEDTVARIAWDATASVPSSIIVRQYSGVAPPHVGGAPNAMNFYNDISAPAGSYLFDAYTYYHDTWMGENPTEADLRLIKYVNPSWLHYSGSSSSVNTTRNYLLASTLYDFGLFTGTDNYNPLPVELNGLLTARKAGKDVFLTWGTASEINSDRFGIEVSRDGREFTSVGSVKAAGSSSSVLSYDWVHALAFAGYEGTLYYRLRMIDMDGSHSFSNVAVVNGETESTVTVSASPNPFVSSVKLDVLTEKAGAARVVVTDLTGRIVLEKGIDLRAGVNAISLAELQNETSSMFFVNMVIDGTSYSTKLVRSAR